MKVRYAEVKAAKRRKNKGRRPRFTAVEADKIRRLYVKTDHTAHSLSVMFQVSVPTICSILNGTGVYKY